MHELIAKARKAQRAWSGSTLDSRLAIMRRIRHAIADHADDLALRVSTARQTTAAQALVSEVLPLAEACRFLERSGKKILRPARLGRKGRPLWLAGSEVVISREPLGVVLIIGPSNYPLFLSGAQALQALTAGNAVLLKPGTAGSQSAEALRALMKQAGLEGAVFQVLDESAEAAEAAIAAGVDKVILTGSAATGRSVLRLLAPTVTQAVMELSGCDAVFILHDSDLALVAGALRFGMTLNGGATCIAPRRAFVARPVAAPLEQLLVTAMKKAQQFPLTPQSAAKVTDVVGQALHSGARIVLGGLPRGNRMGPLVLADAAPEMAVMQEDLMAPVLALAAVDSDQQALELSEKCPYALGATVFGSPQAAREMAACITAGVVVINDMIAPTADPRVPFGGAKLSGFGATRGEQGLVECTRTKAVILRSGSFRPHLDEPGSTDARLFSAYIKAAHGGSIVKRVPALAGLFAELLKKFMRRSP